MNMQDEILSAWRGRNQLAVMVTHDVDEAIYMGTRVIVMEPSPGRIKADIPIKLDYPRNRSSAQFIEYRNQILNAQLRRQGIVPAKLCGNNKFIQKE